MQKANKRSNVENKKPIIKECQMKDCTNEGTDRFTFEDTGEFGYLCMGCIRTWMKGTTIKEALEMDWIGEDTAKRLELFYYSKRGFKDDRKK